MTSRYIVVGPDSANAATDAAHELATALSARGTLARIDALAGTTPSAAATSSASALPAAVEAVRAADADFVLIDGVVAG